MRNHAESLGPASSADAHDIAVHQAATKTLAATRARSEALLAAIPDQILRFDRAGRYLGSAGKISPGTAWTDEVLGKTVGEILPPALARQCQESLDVTFANGGVNQISYSNARPDGLHYFETRVSFVADDECLAVVRDVTDASAAAAHIQRLVQILDAMPDAVCLLEINGPVQYSNAAFRTFMGQTVGEPTQMSDIVNRFPEMRPRFRSMVIPQAVQHGYWRGDLEFSLGDTSIPLSTTVIAHRRPGEAPTHVSIIGRDIRKRQQNEKRLIDAAEAAEAASKAKGEFLATMSHEIRTPMNGVIGAVELLMGSELTDEQRDLASTLRDSSEALLVIINDILDFSKIEAGSLELESIPFDLRSAIDGVCQVLGSAAIHKGLQLLVDVDEGVPSHLMGDPARLKQVLINLVGNAIKFTASGEVVVRASRTDEVTDDSAAIRFEVSDTGMGISQEAQARLFQSFTQVDSSMSRRFGGTGLGLAISRRLVALMGGELSVDSRVGMGSTFWFRARFHRDPSAVLPAGDRPLNDMRILLLDDKPTSHSILVEQLHGWGICVTAEANVAATRLALRNARRSGQPFACLLVDDPVAGLSGEVMAAQFDPAADLMGTAVIVLGRSVVVGEQPAQVPSGTIRLSKPVRASALLDCLVHLLMPSETDIASGPAAAPDVCLRPDARILLVEDNEINRKIACAILNRLGYSPDVAVDGFEAIRIASQIPYDLILMDCQMPGMDGFEATRKLRALEDGKSHVAIVALTANATAADRDFCLAAGMDDYLSKPVRSAALRETMTRWLADLESSGGARPVYGVDRAVSMPQASSKVLSAGELPLLNLDAMAEIRSLNLDDGEDMLAPLVDLFIEQATKQVSAIEMAIQKQDANELGSVAHALKGAARNVGAFAVGEVAAELEQRGKSGSATETGLAVQLEATLVKTRSAYLAERIKHSEDLAALPAGQSAAGANGRVEAA
ncbi:MAG TPA: ATP-binding protein [Candidatus Limnocylindrales bacterium]